MADILEFPTKQYEKNMSDDFIRVEYDRLSAVWGHLISKLHCLDARNHAYFESISYRKDAVLRRMMER